MHRNVPFETVLNRIADHAWEELYEYLKMEDVTTARINAPLYVARIQLKMIDRSWTDLWDIKG